MADPIDAIETMLNARGWTRRHLMAALGQTSKISEIMNRKRPLSIGMIRCLVFNYGMDAETMIQWYPTKYQPKEAVNVFLEVFKETGGGPMGDSEGRAKGGYARAESLSPERRSEIARKAAKSRWEKESEDV